MARVMQPLHMKGLGIAIDIASVGTRAARLEATIQFLGN